MEGNRLVVFGKILSNEDFNGMCRCCLSPGRLIGIFEVLYEGIPLMDILYNLFGTQVDPKDDLPKKLCESCMSEVIRCYIFKKRYEASEAALRNMIAIKIEDVASEVKSEPSKDNCEELGETRLEEVITDSKENKISNTAEKNLEHELIKITKQKQSILMCSCEETFTSKLKFREHQELTKHQLPHDHQCKICGKVYTKEGLRAHARTHGVKRYHCEHCEQKFISNTALQIHRVIHTGERPYICEFCEKSFAHRSALTVHRRLHTGEKPYLCDFCGKCFAKKINCKVHMRIHNKQQQPVKGKPSQKFVCDMCGKLYHSQTAYKLHLYKHSVGEGQVVKNNQHQCKICKKFFASRSSLSFHMLTHDDEKRFLCNVCGKRFRTKTTLESHSLVHSGEKSFVCGICGKEFARQQSLEMHRSVHTGETPYTCPLCDKKFTQNSSLVRHLKIHKGERPYVCTFCDKSFLQKYALNVHLRVHTGEKPYKCDQCTNVFCDFRTLKRHKERKHQQI